MTRRPLWPCREWALPHGPEPCFAALLNGCRGLCQKPRDNVPLWAPGTTRRSGGRKRCGSGRCARCRAIVCRQQRNAATPPAAARPLARLRPEQQSGPRHPDGSAPQGHLPQHLRSPAGHGTGIQITVRPRHSATTVGCQPAACYPPDAAGCVDGPRIGLDAPRPSTPCPAPSTATALRWRRRPPPPPCDIPSDCCFFTGPWTVTRSSLRMLRRVAAFCRLLRPVLLLVSFPRSRSPVVGVLGLCWRWRDVPFARQRRPVVGVLRMCWLLAGSFDCVCCPHTSVHRPSIACLAVFPLCLPSPPPSKSDHHDTETSSAVNSCGLSSTGTPSSTTSASHVPD